MGMTLAYPSSRSYALQVLNLQEHGRASHCYAYQEGGLPLYAWGALPYWTGVAELWMVVDERMNKRTYMRPLIDQIALELDLLVEEFHFHRLFGQYEVKNVQSAKITRLLGFEREGILRQYGADKADFIMCARIH